MAQTSQPPVRVGLPRILLYSSASIGLNIMGITLSTWLLYFYSPPPDSGNPIYLPITLVGVLSTIAIIWDAAIDPFIGQWSDSIRGRWGRRRPFLLIGAPLAALALIVIWLPPGGSSVWIIAAFFFIVNIVYRTSFSMVGIPYDGSMAEIAPDNTGRVALSGWKNVFGIIGVLLASAVFVPLYSSRGPVAMGIGVAIVGLITIWMAVPALRETPSPGRPIPVLEGIRATFQNRQFRIVLFSTLAIYVGYGMINALLPYFVTLVLGKGEEDVATYLLTVIGTMIVFTPIWYLISRRFSNRKLLLFTMIGIAVASALNFLPGLIPGLPPGIMAFVTLGLVGPVLGGYLILIYAMMGSVVDYDEMLTGTRREAIYYGTFSFARGVGDSLAALILPVLLSTFGYTVANPLGVRVSFLAIGLLALLGALIFLPYRLGDTPEETRANLGLESIGTLPAADR